jgi:hypothetical protein
MTATPTQTPAELRANFLEQQKKCAEEIQQLDAELARRKELFLKLQGAIESMNILEPPTEGEQVTLPETTSDASGTVEE